MEKAKKSWYAVLEGRQPGLYRTWDECKKQVDRYPGALFMGFFSREEALEWIDDEADEPVPDYTTRPAATAPAGLLLDQSTQGRQSVNGLSSIPTSSLSCILSSNASSSSGSSAFYAVARGRRPGIYHTWGECRKQVDGFSDARFRKFKTLTEATEFLAVYGGGGHFSQFTSQAFEPDNTASFSEEWARLSQSQGWTRGTKHYSEQRACALRNELQTHFFAPPSRALPAIKSEESEEEGADAKALAEPPAEDDHQRHEEAVKLHGFQSMCKAVGKRPGDTIGECARILNQTLVNIVDLIDASRMGSEKVVKIWTDFEDFRAYTLNSAGGDKTIPAKLAAKDPLLKCFLQNFRRPRGHYGGAMGCGGAVIKKRARSEEDDDFEDCGHQNKRIMCC
ncbi:hypothetical protein INS49_009456 [Diaporthe citri]|uniref:uncharacterized protein n=1 Tax=Diaporthe citri TaxID=83186 RepID=UPI001C7F1B91|nr:uncharacterized protein INS49_009456 [Diaporthe citri]KAG6361232.1 hypothetical protein INS49_009456 [Diaporthe citri]